MKFLIDTGASKNYIKPLQEIRNIMPVDAPFLVKSIHGFDNIKYKCFIKVFGMSSPFFILPGLATFDGIIGLDLLTQVNATICLKKKEIYFDSGSEAVKFYKCQNVNFVKVDDIEVPLSVRADFQKMMKNRVKAFADSNELLPFNTSIVATIRTESNDPIY